MSKGQNGPRRPCPSCGYPTAGALCLDCRRTTQTPKQPATRPCLCCGRNTAAKDRVCRTCATAATATPDPADGLYDGRWVVARGVRRWVWTPEVAAFLHLFGEHEAAEAHAAWDAGDRSQWARVGHRVHARQLTRQETAA